MFNTEEGRKILKVVWIVLLILAVYLGAQTLSVVKGMRNTNPVANTISVTGEGEIVSLPDIATFTFTVSEEAQTVDAAQEQVTTKMDKTLAALKSLGIEEKDVKTTDYSVYPKYTYGPVSCSPTFCPPSRQTLDGYTVSHSVSVKVRDTAKAGEALSAVGENGATNVSGVSFTVDEPEKLVEEARAQAIKEARAKAKTLAKELDVRLVKIVRYYDSSRDGSPMPLPYGSDAVMMRESVGSAPNLPTGENETKVTVTIEYEIR
ncbi:MAG: SIMPL domain-containing protein [bacterium]|nr:SIMPL domain-containing protein [bacterium]